METLPIVLFLLSLLIGYNIRRRAYLGPLDPLQLLAVSEAVWVATISELHRTGVASNAQVTIFAISIAIWWSLWCGFTLAYGRAWVKAVKGYWLRLDRADSAQVTALVGLYAVFAFVVLMVTLAAGGGGDNRLSVMKFLRPIEGVTAILPIPVIYVLLTRKAWSAKLLLGAVLVQMIATGGKSAILLILLPLTGLVQTGKLTMRPKHLVGVAVLLFGGFAASVVANYGVDAPGALLDILYTRVSLDGDVYLLALTNDVIYHTSTSSLLNYLTGPILKALLLPLPIDENIGSQIASIISGQDTPNGPNPHWPVVLMAYGVPALTAAGLSVIAFSMALFVKFRVLGSDIVRTLPLAVVVPLGAFCLGFPQTYFADPTFALIYLVQSVIVALLLCAVFLPLEMIRLPHAHHRHRRA